MGLRTKLGAATSGWSGIGVGMEADLAAIASRAERHASEPRYRAEDLVYEAWEAAGPRRAVLARRALALWPDCADGYVLLAQAASSWSARGPGWPKSRRRSYTPERPVWLRAAPCFLRP
jgi:hypothetical protein